MRYYPTSPTNFTLGLEFDEGVYYVIPVWNEWEFREPDPEPFWPEGKG